MNSDRAAERESRLREAERILEEEIQKACSIQKELNERDAERTRILAEQKKEELTEDRTHLPQEIAKLEAKLEAAAKETLDALREARRVEVATLNTKKLEINQKTHEARIAKEERLQMFDESKNDEQKKNLLKKDGIIMNGENNSSALLNSLARENEFEAFKQQCNELIAKHRRFCMEYDNIESQVIQTVYRQSTR
uniref:Uncharacterized protein n=1 Tax=Caenorhabditis tropicalis TaxID=1561998 RepID=A0A1I7SZ03_9PELO